MAKFSLPHEERCVTTLKTAVWQTEGKVKYVKNTSDTLLWVIVSCRNNLSSQTFMARLALK